MKDKYAYTEVFDVIQISVFPKAEIPGRGIAYYGESNFRISNSIGFECT